MGKYNIEDFVYNGKYHDYCWNYSYNPNATATLMTENGEVALANENGVLVGKCNSDVSADAGFFDAKIKLADTDGECYSNKIQLHVERSPQ